MKGREFFDHTADIGLRVRGRNLTELFANAALGFLELVTDPAKVGARNPFEFTLEADNLGELLVKWLRELVYLFAAKGMMFSSFDFITLNEKKLAVRVSGESFSSKQHEPRREVKAVTYHGFKLDQGKDGWVAEVIFDI